MSTSIVCFVALPEDLQEEGRLKKCLEAAASRVEGGSVRCVFETGELGAAVDRADGVLRAIQRADVIIPVVDASDPNLTLSLGMALALQKPLLPVRACSLSELPRDIALRYWVEFESSTDSSVFSQAVTAFFQSALRLCAEERPPSDRCVFICHRSLDKNHVQPVASSLQGFGFKVWYDSWSLKPGDGILKGIHIGLEQATHFLIFMSTHTLESNWVGEELETAITNAVEKGTPHIIPVYIDEEGRQATPTKISKHKGVFLYKPPLAATIDELVDAIESETV